MIDDSQRRGAALTRVVIVEDDPWIQWMIADVLADRGYEIMAAPYGVDALCAVGMVAGHLREVLRECRVASREPERHAGRHWS